MTSSEYSEFLDLLATFDRAMLVTKMGDGELRGRPMAIVDRSGDARLWFITSVESGAMVDTTEHSEVAVCLQDGNRFLSITGVARATQDQTRISELWTEKQRVWFEHGRDDPALVLLEVVPSHAKFWDRSGVKGLKFLLAEMRARLTGETLSGDEAHHGKIEF